MTATATSEHLNPATEPEREALHMNEDALDAQMMERLLATQSPLGRLRLRLYARWKRMAWRVAVRATFAVKRLLDVVVSAVALVLLSPVFLVIAAIVRRDGGPVFFRQTRIGLHGREFKMLKFRSMVVDAEARLKELLDQHGREGSVTVLIRDDPRITRIGKFLRRSSLDELPQFWNVLRGDMSLVGPRPPVPREVALYSLADRRRLLVKPGMTCLWQIGEREGRLLEVGHRHRIEFPEQVELDVRYIESQSFFKDLWILAKTIPAILFGRLT